jgi:hypothetical protein
MLSSGFGLFRLGATLGDTGLYNYLGDLQISRQPSNSKTPGINFQLPTLPSQLNNPFHHAAFLAFLRPHRDQRLPLPQSGSQRGWPRMLKGLRRLHSQVSVKSQSRNVKTALWPDQSIPFPRPRGNGPIRLEGKTCRKDDRKSDGSIR